MLKYTVTAKNAQGDVVYCQKIEGKVFAENALLVQAAKEDVKRVKITRYLVTTGVTETVKVLVK
jgi:hypothetical protein